MGCLCTLATSVVRILVFVFNFLLLALGLALLITGILYKLKVDIIVQIMKKHDLEIAPTMFIVLGTFLFVVSFFGCCGALKQNSCMLGTWVAILIVLLILEIVGCYYAFKFVNDSQFENELTKEFNDAVQHYGRGDWKEKTDMVDQIQIKLKCCGTNGPDDYNYRNEIPSTCCGFKSDSGKVCNKDDAYTDGCTNFMKKVAKDIGKVIGTIAIITALVLIGGIFFGTCLACR